MIPKGTRLAGANVLVEDVNVWVQASTWQRAPNYVPVYPVASGEAMEFVEVETWFGGSCRDCLHRKNVGFRFLTTVNAEILMKSDDYLPVRELKNGHRLRSIGCHCGYEEVKSVTTVRLGSPLEVFSVAGPANYGITDGDRVVLLRGNVG